MKKTMDALVRFRDARDWKQFHTPDNLAKSIVIEAAELLEHFQWDLEPDLEAVKDEVADVLAYALMLCERYGFDPETIVLDKMEKNAKKYPLRRKENQS